VISMPTDGVEREQSPDGVNLLLSILIRYPEVSTVSLNVPHNCLNLKFMLSTAPSAAQLSSTKRLLFDSITAYSRLENVSFKTSDIHCIPYDQLAILNIVRDIPTISNSELSLITTLVRDLFQTSLLVDPNESLLEEDLLLRDEIIENMLDNLKTNPPSTHGLIGIRENGRILIYSK